MGETFQAIESDEGTLEPTGHRVLGGLRR